MQFVEEQRHGEVLGNKVIADPIPWSAMYGMQKAQKSGEDTAIVEAMADIVTKYVKMADGTHIDAQTVSPRALTALFKFATEDGEETSVADFTSRPSDAQPGVEKA